MIEQPVAAASYGPKWPLWPLDDSRPAATVSAACGSLAGVLKRRAARVLLSGFVMTVAVSGLTACRTSPNVAAYVGEEQVSVTELENAVAARLEDPELAAFAEGQQAEFTRRVLSLLVRAEVHDVAAERYGVQVDDDDVRRRIQALLAGATRTRSTASSRSRASAGRTSSRPCGSSWCARRSPRPRARPRRRPRPNCAPGTRRSARSSPRSPSATSPFPTRRPPRACSPSSPRTPPPTPRWPRSTRVRRRWPRSRPAARDQIPAPLAEGIAAAAPNTGFSIPVPEVGGVIVTFVEGPVYPPFEEVRPQLEQEAAGAAQEAGGALVDAVREDLGVTVNPRYGVLTDGELVPGDGGVVDILEEDGRGPGRRRGHPRELIPCRFRSSSRSVPACRAC